MGSALAGRRSVRTRYRAARWRAPDILLVTLGTGIAAGALAGAPTTVLAAAAAAGLLALVPAPLPPAVDAGVAA